MAPLIGTSSTNTPASPTPSTLAGRSDEAGTVGLRRARTLWKVLEIVAVVVAAVLWFTYSFLWMYYDSTRPRIPDSGADRIYRLNTHGSIVYLTRGEEFLLNVLML